jgi:hypothetical protein
MRCKVPVVCDSHNLMGDELATYFGSRSSRKAAGVLGRRLYDTLRDFTWDAVLPAVERVYGRCGGGGTGYSRYEVGGEEQ